MPRYRIRFLEGGDQVVDAPNAQVAVDEYLSLPEAEGRKVLSVLLGEDESTVKQVDEDGDVVP